MPKEKFIGNVEILTVSEKAVFPYNSLSCPEVFEEMESIQYIKIGSCSGGMIRLWNAIVPQKQSCSIFSIVNPNVENI